MDREQQREAFRKKNAKRKIQKDKEVRAANKYMGELLSLGRYRKYTFVKQQEALKQEKAEKEARKSKRYGVQGRAPNKPRRV